MDDPSDETLFAQARTGDRAALETLLERQQGRVYRFGMKMCRDSEDAKDVVQETLFALARDVRNLRGTSSLSTWLYAVARSFCVKKRRKSADEPAVHHPLHEGGSAGEAQGVADAGPTPDAAFATREVERALDRALATLEPMYREVLLLRDVEGLPAAEVAEIVGLSVPAVKSRLHRARLAARSALAPLLGVPLAESHPREGCPDVLALFSQHLEDEISADVCADMEKHLTACSRCRATCDSLKQTLALCRTSRTASAVPVAVQSSVRAALREFLARMP